MSDISELQKQEFEPLDLTRFEGERRPIKNVEKIEVPSTFNSRGKQWVLKISCEPLLLEGRESSPIIPSELFNLTEVNGKAEGWSSQGNLQKFLDRFDVKHPEELCDRNVVLSVRKKGEQEFLGFVTR